MNCPLSAKMTHDKCNQIRRTNPTCLTCNGAFTHSVVLELPASIYEVVKKCADKDGISVAEGITAFITECAAQMVGRERACT